MLLQAVNGMLSSFGASIEYYALKRQDVRQVTVSLLGAFLVVMAAGFALGIASSAIDAAKKPATTEPVAYQPGRYIASHTSGGYIGLGN